MTLHAVPLDRGFEDALRRHLAHGDEESRNAAYQLGRGALEQGLGVLDTVAALARALVAIGNGPADGADPRLPALGVEAFVLEALSPFEMAHRGVREANLALRRVDEVREEEMRRISRELHDSAGQTFATVHLAIAELADRSGRETADELSRVQVLLVRAEEQLRRLAYEFRPVILDELGLIAALEELAASVASRTKLMVGVEGRLPARLPPRLEFALYRSVQEALANAARHARARSAAIRLRHEAGAVRCEVADDGVGFDPGASVARPGGGLGLRSIRERIAAVGGTLEIRSKPGAGTLLEIALPLEVPHVDARADRR